MRCYGAEVTPPRALALLGAACALVPALLMWGFTVDDALIPVRYAHNLATGAGYRFDAHGPSTDGVTPLPWALVLAPLAAGDALTTLARAKVLGVLAWTAGGAALGARASAMIRERARVHTLLAAAALVVMALAFPIGAWAASGMETGVATMLATVAVTRLEKPRQASALAGMAAVLRPEMVAWSLAVALGSAAVAGERTSPRAPRVAVESGLLAGAPFLGCALVRLVVFGRPAPLAVLAKPSDFTHGAIYAAAATLVLSMPLLVLAPVALVRNELRVARVVVVAFLAHLVVVVAVGGDWMPYARLLVPVAPSLVLAFVDIASATRLAWSAARLALASLLALFFAVRAAPAGRSVYGDRADLIAHARPVLASAEVVAALDVGWVSASTDGRLVDLAGLTDVQIAMLPGGHTSKRVDVAMLLDRGVDAVIVYSEPRVVESRIVASELFAMRFEAAERLPVGSRGASYRVYRRRP